jgi:type I restriction enzyme M protein
MVEAINPRLGEVILDPACGTGGFLVETFSHLEKQCKTVQDRKTLQEKSILGSEAKPLPYLLSQMNLLLHGLEYPRIIYGNSLAKPWGKGDRDRSILSHQPPSGREERGILRIFPAISRPRKRPYYFSNSSCGSCAGYQSPAAPPWLFPTAPFSETAYAPE